MATLMTHAAVPLALWYASDTDRISLRLLAVGVIATLLPDLDVIAFYFQIPYADLFGHRGITHSFIFSATLAFIGMAIHNTLGGDRWQVLVWIALCALSHPLLDAMTSGGLGVAFWWPFNEQRLFAIWRPIRVSPFLNNFFSEAGLRAVISEIRWIWLPLFATAGIWRVINRTDNNKPY